jgi:predicted methyltransferase MtxX (methanogen marker protein 4)
LTSELYALALRHNAKVALGLDPALPSAERVVNSAIFASREKYARPVLVSQGRAGSQLLADYVAEGNPVVITEDASRALVEMLREGIVDAAVRGNLSSKVLVPALKYTFGRRNLQRITILDIANRKIMLAPVGIEEGEEKRDLIAFASHGRALAQTLGIPFKLAVLSGGRLEDRGRSVRVDKMLDRSDALAEGLKQAGIEANDYGIELERAIDEGATMLLAPDGVIGNIIFRSLVLVGNIDSFGAYAASLPKVYVDTSRAKGSYLLPIVLASALAG